MTSVTVAAVQAAYVLMDQQACVDKTVTLLREATDGGARIVVFPEVFIPGTPIWIDSRPIWDGDGDWYAMLVDQAVVVPGPVTEALGAAARANGMLTLRDRPAWRVVRGGSARYVEALIAPLRERIRLATPVTAVTRDDTGVTVTVPGGPQRFDHVVLALHSDQALAVLGAGATPQ